MVTAEEQAKFNDIRDRVRAGRKDSVTADEKQFVLDMLAKLNAEVDPDVIQHATAQGFNTTHLKSAY